MKINTSVVQFMKNAILFLLVFITIDVVFGIIFDKVFFSQKRKQTYVIEQCNENMLIFGSSRAQHHYNSEILADSLGMKVYNAGVGGQNIYFHYALLKSVLNRYRPDIVLLEVFDIDIYKTPSGWNTDKLSALYPYYHRDSTVKEIVNLRSPFESYILASNLVRYNSQILYTLMIPLFYDNSEMAYRNMGYTPIDAKLHLSAELLQTSEDSYGGVIDSNKVDYLRRFADLCNSKKVRCLFAISPIYQNVGNTKYVSTVKDVAKECNVEFNDFSNEPTLMKPEYFKDISHMNDKGARLYSYEIVYKIKNIFNKREYK